jgi:YD repeat-containing protein
LLASFEFYESGELKKKTSPAGTIEYFYSQGKLSQVKDRCGNITEFTYDIFGNLKTVKDATGNTTYYYQGDEFQKQ